MSGTIRDHGGDLDAAMAEFGGAAEDWIDLSTGINRQPYPLATVPEAAWRALPTRAAMARLTEAAQAAWNTGAPAVALAGAQAAIQMVPRLGASGLARVLGPTYNEHAASLRTAGWRVEEVTNLDALAGADLAVVVNPNNPDGRRHAPDALMDLLPRTGRLIVDESFGDPDPALSLLPQAGRPGLLVLRSFGKFYGLAGLRLGFAFGPEADIAALSAMAGPWPVSGPAIEIGAMALGDRAWAAATAQRLAGEAERIDRLAQQAGWPLAGGTTLFRLYETPDAPAARRRLARHHIWSRIFPWSPHFLRLGLPGDPAEWARLEAALAANGTP